MSDQKWADASTQNCVWLLQSRNIPSGCYEEKIDNKLYPIDHEFDDPEDVEYVLIEDSVRDDQCWDTVGVFLNRLEAFEAGARRVYNYGKYGTDWRIYGVPAHGVLVEHLASTGINQEYIDQEVSKYESERKEWEKVDERLKR